MSINETSSFAPEEITPDEFNTLHKELIYRTRMEAYKFALDDGDHAAIRHLDGKHIDIHIAESEAVENRILFFSWSYSIKIRRKLNKESDVDQTVHHKEDVFTPSQIASILNNLSETMRLDAAHEFILDFIENYFKKEAGYTKGKNWKKHIPDIIEAIDDRFPGQLQRLHERIRSGTLGKDVPTKN